MASYFTEYNINEDHRFINRYKFGANVGKDVTLKLVQELFQNEADKNGIPVAFHKGVLETGGFFNKKKEDVLDLYNPEHETDYLHFMIRITHQGNYAFCDVFKVGGSKNYASSNRGKGSAFFSIINSATGLRNKLEAEENYYSILADCMMEALG